MSRATDILKKFIDEDAQAYTNKVRTYLDSINKQKKRIPVLKDNIKQDQERIRNKNNKLRDTEDVDLKDKYNANIERLDARVKETQATIKEIGSNIKDKEKKLAKTRSNLRNKK